MSTTHTLETKILIEAMESRAKEYRLLRDQFQELKTSFKDIVDLDDFKGKTADSVKGFYRAQIDVVNSWIDFIDLQEAFFKGIKGMADDEDLGGKTLVHLPFLDSDLKNSESRARQMVDSQEQALEDIFSGISDLVSMEPNSTKRFDKHIDEATKKRKETKEKVENFDQTLLDFYEQSKYHENVIAGLISELYKASSQGGEVNPLYFNEDAYKNSDIHTAREEAKEITANYISWQDELERARELENRSFGEKTWDTICTFTGEVTGYYDMKRASTGVDPITGQELTDGQRATAAALAAAGFIPFVGWAGRAVKGGHAIYKTSKTFKAADNALDAYRTTEAFDILKTSERGLYGLASANGFSEFITGRDIFGNPISEEEQQAGFERALLLLPFKGKNATPVLGVRDDARGVSKGTGKETYQHLKDYKNNKYFTRSVEYNAGKDGTGFTYKVYQRGDINWDMVRTRGAKKGRGLTNAEASAKYGLAPILDDAGSVATLHHSQQKGVGPLYEASTRYHNISNAKRAPLHPYKGKLNPFYPMDEATRGAFQKVDSINYWKIRGEKALGGK